MKVKDSTLAVDDQLLNYRVREVGEVIRIGCNTYDRKYLLEQGKAVYGE